MKKTLTFALLLGAVTFMYATGDLNKLDQELKTQSTAITNIINTIVKIITVAFGAISMFKLVQIFISQGSGEEKINKAGIWLFLLIFCAAGYYLSKSIFG